MPAEKPLDAATLFLEREKEFHLGFLPTEQAHPLTSGLDRLFAESGERGVRNLQAVDRDVALAARSTFASPEFERMVDIGSSAVLAGGRLFFSGCGATGRLSILLEAMWRKSVSRLAKAAPERMKPALSALEDCVSSIMTGGDYALIRSVESFEDYGVFGKRQTLEAGLRSGDVLIAVTEGGETASVLGTVEQALAVGSAVFLLFNNPACLLAQNLQRSRRVIQHPGVTVLELYSGPMAVAGSTRMQAVTYELLVAGAALERIFGNVISRDTVFTGLDIPFPMEAAAYASAFETLLEAPERDDTVAAITDAIDFESAIYRRRGRVTYFADKFLLDILTDTTERAPTFMLPPFRKKDDLRSPPSWAFVKHPFCNTPEVWSRTLGRAPRCLAWKREDYCAMGASEKICSNPPRLDEMELFKFAVGCEPEPSRYETSANAAVLVVALAELEGARGQRLRASFEAGSDAFQRCVTFVFGDESSRAADIRLPSFATPLALFEHLAVKLVMNTISTGSMVKLGRVSGNWMSCVELTNKKLTDRGIRVIAELCGKSYEQACYALFEALAEMRLHDGLQGRISPVQYAMQKFTGR